MENDYLKTSFKDGKTFVDITQLTNWKNNPRNISNEGLSRLKKQIQELGQHTPLLVDKQGVVYGGNMRLRAYKELGITEIWVNIIEGDEARKLQYALSSNDRAGFYEEKLLEKLNTEFPHFAWSDYAVDLKEPTNLGDLIDKLTPVDEDDVPEASDEPAVSKLGEVYQLGQHRVMCGSATSIEDVEKLMGGGKADMVLTDPPYNTGMTEKTQSEPNRRLGHKSGSTWLSHMFNDSFTPEQFDALITDSLANMYAVTKGSAVFYVCIDWRNVGYIKDRLEKLMPVKNVIVWDKMVHGLGSDYKFTYEMIVVGKKGEPKIENRIGTDYQDVWHVQRKLGRNDEHATAKPIELCKKPILHASKQDDIVLDLFLGSGSTLIACEQTNRICYGTELDPKYCDVIRKRYWRFANGNEEGWEEATPVLA